MCKHWLTLAALGAAGVLVLSSCGGDASTPEARATATKSSSRAATQSAPHGDGTSEAQLAATLCMVIRKVQKDLGDGAVPAAYLAQFTLGMAGVLDNEASIRLFQSKGDALAKKSCPAEYQKFLKQAQVDSLIAA